MLDKSFVARACAVLLVWLLPVSAFGQPAVCPQILNDAPALGDPAHSAQVHLSRHDACPRIRKIAADLYAADTLLVSRSYYDEAIANPPLVFPVAEAVSLPDRAGLYRIDWRTEFVDGSAQLFTQTFTVPCPAPQAEAPRWSDADSSVVFSPLPGDTCEGDVSARVELVDIAGVEPVEAPAVSYQSHTTTPEAVAVPLGRLEGERRYTGNLVLENEAGRTTTLPVEFISGCGPLEPSAAIVDGRMVGAVAASQCQYPIDIALSVVHESGNVIRELEAVLMEQSFDFALPDFDAWPAGSYRIETQFIGATGRARLENSVAVACPEPRLTAPTLEVSPNGSEAEVLFDLVDRDICQEDTRVTLQVRDVNRVVVFNRTVDLPAGSSSESLRLPFLGIPGAIYDLGLNAAFGLNHESSVERTERVVYDCTAPEVLGLGYSTPDATHLSGLVALTGCNAPATAKLVVRNAEGRVVVDADPQIIQDVGTAYARISPISLGHLDSGQYQATLTIADNKARVATREIDFVRDVDGPTIEFALGNAALEADTVPTLAALDELTLTFRDAHSPMPPFSAYSDQPQRFPDGAELIMQQIEGESTPQLWFTGLVDLPRESPDWSFIGLAVQGAAGTRWLAPVSQTFVPSDSRSLADFHPSRLRIGFRAVGRVQPLEPGRFVILGLVMADPSGVHHLLPGTGSFTVSTLASQQHDAVLRQGVAESPIALSWSSDKTARLKRITSVPDGDYTLSAIGRDIFGNRSTVASIVLRLDQEKDKAELDWPAIVGYGKVLKHRFRHPDAAESGPLRVLYRRVDGYGNIRINDRNVTDQAAEDLLEPDATGLFTFTVELLDADVDARIVLHADSTEAKPLELAIQTFGPSFVTQRTRTDAADLLSIQYGDAPCRSVLFSNLSEIQVGADEVLCAVRLNVPGADVSTADARAEVRLPDEIARDALYEEGFVRRSDGMPVFHPTRQVPIEDMQAYSSTPQVEFVPLSTWRSRAVAGRFLTSPGEALAGHLLIRPGPAAPVLEVNGERVSLPSSPGVDVRVPLRTTTAALGERFSVDVRAWYADTPKRVFEQTFEFVAVAPAVDVEAVDGRFVAPDPLNIVLRLADISGEFDPARHGTFSLQSVEVQSRLDPSRLIPSPTAEFDDDGVIRAALPPLDPGPYQLRLTLKSTDPRYRKHLKAVNASANFDVLDGTPVDAQLFSFRRTDKTPFFGQLSVDYGSDTRRRDVSRVSWEVSDDGEDFAPLKCCGQSVDFALIEPGVRHYRAELTNRHSGVTSYTAPIQITGFLSGTLEVIGPRQTFRGFPADYRVEGLPENYEVLWRVTTPNATVAQEIRSPTLTIPADETGVYHVEVVADTASGDPDSLSALRTYFTLETSWPRLPESVISGPTQVEYGKTYTYTVTHPPIFEDRGNVDIKRVGEWELPDGSRVKDDEWTQFTLRDMPDGYTSVDVLYHTWIEGDPTTLTTAVHTIRPVTYRWPNWELKVATNSVEPPAILRLSVTPEDWRDWMGLGASPVTTHWQLPNHLRVLYRTPTEAIVATTDDRAFNVRARISDPRGNITELEQRNIRPLKALPFEIALRAVPDRALHTAPLWVTAHIDPVALPKGREISRVAFYVDGTYRGVSDGSPLRLQIRSPGEHEIRAIAAIGSEYTSDDVVRLTVGDNHQARCTIVPVGDFRLNGLAKAECEDPDGYMIEYRWYANGQLLSDTGTRVQLSRADRLGITELSLVAVDNAGVETAARYLPPTE